MKIEEIKLNSYFKNYSQALMQQTANFLADFCHLNQPKNILEIGTNIGFSACVMLTNSKNAKITTIEKDEKLFFLAKENFEKMNFENQVHQILGDAKTELQALAFDKTEYEKYDLIFLDGPKGQYLHYLPFIKTLLKKGGYLISDNIFFKGKVEKEGFVEHKHRTIVVNLRKFITQIKEDFETELYHIGDGISVSKKR